MRKPLGERQRGRVRLGRRLALLGAVISFGAFALSTWARQDWPGQGLAWIVLVAVTLAGVALLLTLPPRLRNGALTALSVAVFFVLAWATAVLFAGGGTDGEGSALPDPTDRETAASPDDPAATPPETARPRPSGWPVTPPPATARPTEVEPTAQPTAGATPTRSDSPAAGTPTAQAPPPAGGDGTGSAAMITAVGGLVTAISGCVTAAAALKQANTTARQAAAQAQPPTPPGPPA
ncbi:hypothetical protein ACQEVX_22375 [Streptomyces syringium]|uniref:hypothetical protein n=1 Tax=Streptomyces syringium TaxID=76729 RepID=UPI003D8D0639